jgi:uncharacterized protein (DUF2132 family)
MTEHPKDPLYGKTLQVILEELLEKHGWEKLAQRININCFKKDPSIKSSLVFLRKTPWAREKVEELYIRTIRNPKSREVVDSPINLDI